jgi:hypothetical protein
MQRMQYTDPREYVRELSPLSVQLIAACLNPRAQDRPQSAAVVRERLQSVLRECQLIDPRDVISRYLREPRLEAKSIRQRQVSHLKARLQSDSLAKDPAARREIVKRIGHLEQRTRAPARLCREKRATDLRSRNRVRVLIGVAAGAAIAAGAALGFLLDVLK